MEEQQSTTYMHRRTAITDTYTKKNCNSEVNLFSYYVDTVDLSTLRHICNDKLHHRTSKFRADTVTNSNDQWLQLEIKVIILVKQREKK